MNNLKRKTVAVALVALPLISEAHPGHDGDHGQSMAGLVLLAAAFVAIGHSIAKVRAKLQSRTDRPKR